MEKIKFKLLSKKATLPTRATDGSAGFDLYTVRDEYFSVDEETVPVEFDVAVQIPEGYVGLLFVRSSIGKQGICLKNGVGVIDSDYRGPIIANLYLNFTATYSSAVTFNKATRLCQLVVVPCLTDAELVGELDETDRGEGGFGSTGE